jgi:hypothetical protein
MNEPLRTAFQAELREAKRQEQAGELAAAFRHLERAHVLSQRYAWPHVRVHLHMLGFGLRRGDAREVWGQLARVLVAAPGSWLGRAPRGNTGGANVGIRQPMVIPEDLLAILDADAS